LNPLTLLIALVMLRLALPAIVVAVQGAPHNDYVDLMRLSYDDWIRGGVLAATGISGVILGWVAVPRGAKSACQRAYTAISRALPADRRIRTVGLVFLCAGATLILLALALNYGSIVFAVSSGIARHGERVGGTSRFVVGALALLSVGPMMMVRRAGEKGRLASLGPALIAALVLSPLGGRIGALTPLALAGLVYWYEGPIRRLSLRKLLAGLVLGFVLLSIYATFLSQYRTGEGITGGSRAVGGGGVATYVSNALWVDVGALHPYAMATRDGPASLQGSVYPEITGYLGAAAGISGTRPGAEFARKLNAVGDAPWGYHTGLVIDIYVDSGTLVMVCASVLFGALLSMEYHGFRRARRGLPVTIIHALFLWTVIWVYFESVVVATSYLGPGMPVLVVGVLLAGTLSHRPMPRVGGP
jgi:hypothetical protein